MKVPYLPFALPTIGAEEIREVVDTLKSGWLTTGPKTAKFEADFCRYTGAAHAVALSSCTAALHLTLRALGVQSGDEVITSTLTFAATGNMIALLGARPVLADIEPKHFCLDVREIEKKITPRTKGIIAVHYAGHPCNMDEINALARQHNLFVIEDAAHAVGTRYNGKMIGGGENPTCFSFYPIKTMTTGEGGMVTTPSAALADKIRLLSLHGISKDAWKRYDKKGSWFYEIEECGYKYNMTDLQSSLGIVQLKRLEKFIKTRYAYACLYTKGFRGVNAVVPPPEQASYARHSWHLYPILIRRESNVQRDRLIEALKQRNIGTSVHFIPLHLHPYYRKTFGYKPGDFPVAEDIFQRILSLPLYPGMTSRDIQRVVSAVKESVATLSSAAS